MTTAARCSTLALCVAASPALALTPEELWTAWQGQAAAFGVTLGAEAVQEPGGALLLRGFTASEGGGPAEPLPPGSPVQELRLSPAPEGAVAVEPVGLPSAGTVPLGPGEGSLRLEQEGLAITARDGAGAAEGTIAYEARADRLTVAVELLEAAAPGAGEVFALEVAAPAIRVDGGAGAGQTITATLGADGYAYVFDVSDPVSGLANSQSARSEGRITVAFSTTAPAGQGLVALFSAMSATTDSQGLLDVVRALEDGLAMRLEYSNEPTTQAVWVRGAPFSYQYEGRFEAGTGSVSLDRAGVAGLAQAGGGSVTVATPALPFPSLDVAFGALDAEVRAPLGREPGPFRYRVALDGVSVNEEAWAALDPEGRLPREPARLVVDVGGEATLDLAALAAAEIKGEVPAAPSIESLEVRQIELSLAGVAGTAAGSFAFDDAGGFPVPSGTGTARVEGVDRLIDALVAYGWITPEDASSARLGLAFAFRAGDGPDTRVSEVEARPDGSVFVNGVQVQ